MWGIFISPLVGEQPAAPLIDTVRVTEQEGHKSLETIVVTYERDGKTLDVIGAVHLADESYYDELNELFKTYEVVLYEMIGDSAQPKKPVKKRTSKKSGSELETISRMYTMYETLLGLEIQKSGVDYQAGNFLHADMTHHEFKDMQERQGESVMSFALQGSLDMMEGIDQAAVLGAMITGDSTALKHTFIDILAAADDTVSQMDDSSVIIHARNKKCLRVLEQEVSGDDARTKLAIFYGAAHLPDFHKQLIQANWTQTGESWLCAWQIEAQ